MYCLWMLVTYFLVGLGSMIGMLFIIANLTPIPFTWKAKGWPWPPLAPSQTHKTESGREKLKKSALLVNGGRVKRAIPRENLYMLSLWWNLSLTQIPQPFTSQSNPCYKSLKMSFLKTYPLAFLPKRVLSIRLIWFQEPLYPTNLLTDATPLKPRNCKGRFRSWLVEDT